MRTVYRNSNWEEVLEIECNDVVGLIAILKETRNVTIEDHEYIVNGHSLNYDDGIPTFYVDII